MSPRVGSQFEIMLSSKTDLIIRGEYTLASANLGNNWRYTEENNHDGQKNTLNAYWNEMLNGPAPKIDYQGWSLTIGIRNTFFSSFNIE